MLYIPLIEATATSSAPGVAWIMVGKQCARRAVLGFLMRDIRLLLWQRGTSRQNPNLSAQPERLLYCLVSYIAPDSNFSARPRKTPEGGSRLGDSLARKSTSQNVAKGSWGAESTYPPPGMRTRARANKSRVALHGDH